MIARIWKGRIKPENKDVYVAYVHDTGVANYRSTDGNRGSMITTRRTGDVTEIMVVSLWDSYDAIKKFAGEDFERAVYYPEDEKYLLDFPERSEHYDVAEQGLYFNV